MDPSLIVHKFHPFVEKQPLNVHYQEYQADNADRTSCNWNIDSPFAGALLDNEVLVEWTVQIPRAIAVAQWSNSTGTVAINQGITNTDTREELAFAQGFPMVSALAKMECVLNGQSLRTSPFKYIPEFTRFFSHPMETSGIATLAGGELDTESCAALSNSTAHTATLESNPGTMRKYRPSWGSEDTAIPVQVDTPRFPAGPNDRLVNKGYDKRLARMWDRTAHYHGAKSLIDTARTDNNFAPGDPRYTLFERLPLSPFLMFEAKDGKRSIPYVDKMEVTMTFFANHIRLAMQGSDGLRLARSPGAIPDALTATDWFTVKPKLHLRWYIPPPGMVLEPEISIPVSVYKETSKRISASAQSATFALGNARIDLGAFEHNNIRLQQVPDMMFIYLKPPAASTFIDFNPEHHLTIDSIEITINGDSGKLLRASSGELFSMYVRNSPMSKERVYDYDTWRQKYCTAVFVPSDLGVRVPPGVNHGVTLDIRVRLSQYWVARENWNWGESTNIEAINFGKLAFLPRTNGLLDPINHPYDFHFIGIYDKYELTLTNRGNAQLKLQNVPSLDLPQQVSAVDQADLRAQFA